MNNLDKHIQVLEKNINSKGAVNENTYAEIEEALIATGKFLSKKRLYCLKERILKGRSYLSIATELGKHHSTIRSSVLSSINCLHRIHDN